jgi:hypothetical protein
MQVAEKVPTGGWRGSRGNATGVGWGELETLVCDGMFWGRKARGKRKPRHGDALSYFV